MNTQLPGLVRNSTILKRFASVYGLWLLVGLLCPVSQVPAQQLKPAKLDALVDAQLRPAISELRDFVAIPNDAINPEDILTNIQWAEKAFAKRGFQCRVLPTAHQPLFLAQQNFPKNSRTVLFYFHLDGQPVRANEWGQPDPYTAVLKEKTPAGEYRNLDWDQLQSGVSDEWRIFGRSTSDDKGPVIMLLQALDILRAQKQTPPFNIKVLLDTEEEKGSAGLKQSLVEYKDDFRADYMIVMDGPMHSSNIPTLTFGCRGSAGVTLTTYGPLTPQHSGHFGNYAPNPVFLLSRIIASMKDTQGKVLINGYYDGISFDEETRQIMGAVPDKREEINGRLMIVGEEKVGANYQESLQYPSLNVRGMQAAVVGPGSGTIIPEKAVASFDIRLVPETDGKRMVELVRRHLEAQQYTVLDHEPTPEERLTYPQLVYFQGNAGIPAFRTDIHSPIGNWLRRAIRQAYAQEPVIIRIMGGTVPVVPIIQTLNVPAVIVPLVNMDNNQHSPNENLRIGNLRTGIKTCLTILSSPPGEDGAVSGK